MFFILSFVAFTSLLFTTAPPDGPSVGTLYMEGRKEGKRRREEKGGERREREPEFLGGSVEAGRGAHPL